MKSSTVVTYSLVVLALKPAQLLTAGTC